MKVVLAAWLILAAAALAQNQAPKCPPRERYRNLRYDEDWSGLRNSDCRADVFDALKFIPVGEQAYVSLGGEARYRYERYDHSNFGGDPPTDSGYLLQRYLLHADAHFTPAFRVFVQFQSGLEDGRNGGPRPTDRDSAEFHEAFVDVPVAHFRDSPLVVRVGRQELEFGSGRMIGSAEGLNIRRAFDGIRVHYHHGKWDLNSTLLRPVALDPGAFDDLPDHVQTLWGIGGTHQTRVGGFSLYYFGLDRRQVRLTSLTGRDLRHTIGTRWFGARGRWDFNDEYFVQFGSFAHRSLFAGGASFDLGWNLPKRRLKPRFGVRADATSGGVGTAPNASVHTFLPLFPNPPYAGRNALLSPANLLQVSPALRFGVGKATFFLDSPFSWRSSTNDGIYNFGDFLVRPGNRSEARYVGAQPGGQIDLQLDQHWAVNLQYSHFYAGEFLRETPPGKSVDFLVLSTTLRF